MSCEEWCEAKAGHDGSCGAATAAAAGVKIEALFRVRDLAQAKVEQLDADLLALALDRDHLAATLEADRRERDQARADLAKAVEERERLRDENAQLLVLTDAQGEIAIELDKVQAQRDRLRTVLASVVEVSDSESATMDTHFEVLEMARSVLADAAPAVLEPAAVDPRPLVEMVHATEPNTEGAFFVDLECGHRIATREQRHRYRCGECVAMREPAPPERLTLAKARAAVGRRVRYTPLGLDPEGEGTVTSVNDTYVFVRFGLSESGPSIATAAADLVLLP